jgi:hypothetical protein
MMEVPSQERVDAMRRAYVGKRIRLIKMIADPHPITPGTEGECWEVDGMGQLMMNWDNDRTLNLLPGVDQFQVI